MSSCHPEIIALNLSFAPIIMALCRQKWNHETVKLLNKLFEDKGYRDINFVADSALINIRDLNRFSDPDNFIKVISRIPDNYNVVKEVKDQAFKHDSWKEIGTISEKTKAATYRLCSFTRKIGEYQYRLLVVHSSSLDKRKLKKLNNLMEKTRASLQQQVDRLAKESFYCEADAKKALEKLAAAQGSKYYPVSGTVEKVCTEKYLRRGRPQKEEQPVEVTTYRVVPQIQDLNQQAFEELKKTGIRLKSTFKLFPLENFLVSYPFMRNVGY